MHDKEKTLAQRLPIIIVNSHPIQYFAPLYTLCANQGLNLKVWYCSDETVKGKKDKQFGVEVKWNIPLLEGYNYQFFKNYSWKPSLFNGFWGLMNFGIITRVFKEPRSIIIVYGWNYFSTLAAIIFGKISGHTIVLRAESPLNQELARGKVSLQIRKILFGSLLFRLVDKFLFLGKQNKDFYKYYGVPENRLFFAPYSVDNTRFKQAAISLLPHKKKIRLQIGIDPSSLVFLFSAKYIQKKRPLDLLHAFRLLNNPAATLIMVGDGELKPEMLAFINKHQIRNIILTGFVNQSEIVQYYAAADVFVMCSGVGETWGLSVNEAMNFSLPLILSDMPGSGADLLQEGINGILFKTGDVEGLRRALQKIAEMSEQERLLMGQASEKIISEYNYERIGSAFSQL